MTEPKQLEMMKNARDLATLTIKQIDKAAKVEDDTQRLEILRAAHENATDAGAALWHARGAPDPDSHRAPKKAPAAK